MDKFLMIIKSIDWVFASIILIGGRYWGGKYFKLSKVAAVNFLGFATAFAIIWLVIKYYTVGISKSEVGNLFITYLVATSFYEVLAKYVFEQIENLLPWFKKDKKESETVITLKGTESIKEIKEVKPEDKKDK